MSIPVWIIPTCAVIGAGLGIFNLVYSITRNRVWLNVVPKGAATIGIMASGFRTDEDHFSMDGPYPADALAVEVINMSNFPVTVADIGLAYRKRPPRITSLGTPTQYGDDSWPKRLEPRTRFVGYFDTTRLLNVQDLSNVRYVYATTLCRSTRYGTSGALKECVASFRTVVK